MQERTYAGQQLTASANDQTRALKDLNEENETHTKHLRQVRPLVGKNKKRVPRTHPRHQPAAP